MQPELLTFVALVVLCSGAPHQVLVPHEAADVHLSPLRLPLYNTARDIHLSLRYGTARANILRTFNDIRHEALRSGVSPIQTTLYGTRKTINYTPGLVSDLSATAFRRPAILKPIGTENTVITPLDGINSDFSANAAVRLPVQHIDLIDDVSLFPPIISNKPESIVSNLVASGIPNIPPTLLNDVTEYLGSSITRGNLKETEEIETVPLYTEALLPSADGKDPQPVKDFFSIDYTQNRATVGL